MVCHPFSAEPLPELMLTICQLDHPEYISVKPESKHYVFRARKVFENVNYKMSAIMFRSQCVLTIYIEELGHNLPNSQIPQCTSPIMHHFVTEMCTFLRIIVIKCYIVGYSCNALTLQWRHNGLDSVSNHQPHHCLLSRLFRRRSKKTSKLRVTGLCAGNSPGPGEFPAQMASYAENVSIWWRHHDCRIC